MAVVAGIALAAAFAPAAHAGNGTVSRSADGSTITVTFGDGGDSLMLRSTGVAPNGNVVLDENSAAGNGTVITPDPGSGCVVIDDANDDDVSCPRVHNAVAATRLVVELAGGDDYTEVQELTNIEITLDVRGGAGNEYITGSVRADVISGGAGVDELFGLQGADSLSGGSGDDFLIGGQDADSYSGGSGFDRAEMENPSVASGVTVTIDDVANDGTAGGAEGDNVRTDVEDVIGTNFDDVIVGSGAANMVNSLGGNDSLDGGGGGDQLIAGDGNDTVAARDGTSDRIECGSGTDSLTADTIDESDGCEQEDRSAVLESVVTDSDGDGAARPADCDDGNAAVRPGAAETPDNGVDEDCNGTDATVLDRDGDGSPRPGDCNDGDASVRPGAPEVPGNAADENCDGLASPFPPIGTRVAATWTVRGASTRPRGLTARRVPAGATIRLRCRGRGCPFRSKTRRVRRAAANLSLLALVRGMRFRPGARLEVSVTAPATVGTVVVFTVRRGKRPQVVTLCLPPGSRTAREC